MKLLMIYTHQFAFRTAEKNLDSAPEVDENGKVTEAIVAFIHSELEDVEREKNVLGKLVKNIKWLSGKLGTKTVVLHSFAHLSESKAPPEFVQDLFNKAQQKLKNTGYRVSQTPFGYFLDLDIQAPGFSLARVFKNL